MRRARKSRQRKVRDLIDYDYDHKLPPEAAGFLEAFTASFYHGDAVNEPGAVPPDEATRLDAGRRRDIYAGAARIDADVEAVTELPAHRRPFAEERKKHRRAMARKKGAPW